MKNDISNRHRGDLGGRFTDNRVPAKVSISMTEEVAQKPSAQHLTWMLLNLLARQSFEIREIELNIPSGVPIGARLSPLVSESRDLLSALVEGVSQINPAVITKSEVTRSKIAIRVGPGPTPEADFSLAASADGWCGYVGQLPAEIIGESANPIGAYVAASLCAGEVFKFVRAMRETSGTYARRLWLDAYRLQVSEEYRTTPELPPGFSLQPTVIAGVGAVTNGFLHTLYPLDGLRGEMTLIDNDPQGITDTNLGRYVLFGMPHVSTFHLKASTAAAMFAGSGITMHPVDRSWQDWYVENPDDPRGIVISAVDKNVSRHAIQDTLPRLILGAATNGMRAQVNLYDVLGGSPCLRCRNPVEERVADDVIIKRLIELPKEERDAAAGRAGISPGALEEFLADPRANCGKVSGTTLQKFAGVADEPTWSVGFVSLIAGVLSAAEYLKISAEGLRPALTARRNTFRFQFWRPADARTNAVVEAPPEALCLCQTPAFRKAMGIDLRIAS
jgi:hypothetical protein